MLPALPSFLTLRVLSILLMETAERFCYYGFRAVLVLYFNNYLEFSESASISLFAYTTCLAYLSPVFGAIISDSYLGRFKTILIFGLVYLLGLIILTLGAFLPFIDSEIDEKDHVLNPYTIPLTFLGLFFICIGTGGIKPCVSAFGADQVLANGNDSSATLESETNFEIGNNEKVIEEQKIQEFYAWFYFCINLGSVASFLIVPTIRSDYGYGAAFLLSTIFLMVAMISFISRRKEYIIHLPAESDISMAEGEEFYDLPKAQRTRRSTLSSTFKIVFYLLKARLSSLFRSICCISSKKDKHKKSEDIGINEKSSYSSQRQSNPLISNELPNRNAQATTGTENQAANNAKTLDSESYLQEKFSSLQVQDAKSALKVMPVLCMLPAFWMLYDQSSSVWTIQATHMNLHGLQPEQLGAINPILIMILIPLFDGIIYPKLKQWDWNISHLRRMAVGMFVASLSFIVSGLVEAKIEHQSKENTISVAWQLPQILILSISEILVSVTGLEFSYAFSPDSMKAMIMALYLLTTAVGDFFGGLLYTFWGGLDRSLIMYLCAGVMMINLFFFRWVVKWWESSRYSNRVEANENRMSSLLAMENDSNMDRNIV